MAPSMIRRSTRVFSLAILVVAAALPAACTQDELLAQASEALDGYGRSLGVATLSDAEISEGLREALSVASARVVRRVGAVDGFNGDPRIRIPLPRTLRDAQSVLRKVGMARLADDLEVKLNRGAEAAAPEAKRLFLQAIRDMTLHDVRAILDGPDDAATRYFRRKMSPALARRMAPIVKRSLLRVGALRAYDTMIARYRTIPFVPDVSADLTEYVVDKAMDGIFYYVAREEAAIRKDPAARTTALLRRVFGAG